MNDTEDHRNSQEGVSVPVEDPHAKTYKLPAPKGLAARIVLPFFSSDYRTNVTQHCLLRCLTQHAELEDLYADETADGKTPLFDQHREKNELWDSPGMKHRLAASEFFSLYHARFQLAAPLLFHHLRTELFNLPASVYNPLFETKLTPVSNLGFSGSTFFLTDPPKLIVKSIGRRFEYTFLYERLIDAYARYLLRNHSQRNETFLCQITDVAGSFHVRIGEMLGLSPGHYVVMRNILEKPGHAKWDLKPQNFFEPTRDLVPDDIKTERAKSGLADELPDEEHVVLTRKQKAEVMRILERDTEWLCEMGTIDYSVLLGRWSREEYGEGEEQVHDEAGVWLSADGRWVYKMSIVDFLWNVEQLRPKIMQTAGKLLPEQTVTTEPERYRKEFLKMMDGYIEVWDEDDEEDEGMGN